jgi:hypothetical protein
MGFPHTSFSRKGSKVFAKSTTHQYSARKIDKLALFLEKNQKCMLYRLNRVSKPRDLERVPGHDTRLLLLFRKGPRRETLKTTAKRGYDTPRTTIGVVCRKNSWIKTIHGVVDSVVLLSLECPIVC